MLSIESKTLFNNDGTEPSLFLQLKSRPDTFNSENVNQPTGGVMKQNKRGLSKKDLPAMRSDLIILVVANGAVHLSGWNASARDKSFQVLDHLISDIKWSNSFEITRKRGPGG